MNVLLRMLYQKSAENHEILTLLGGSVALTLAIEIADALDAAHAAVDSVCGETTLVQATISAGLHDAGQQLNRIMLANHEDLHLRYFQPQATCYLQPI
jgi:hypothetical protein